MIKLLRKLGYFPRLAVWELTLGCNMNCRHCGSRAGKRRDDELSLPEAQKLAGELADLHCRWVTLGGGEPLMREDWPEIARTLISRGVHVNMVTNGRAWSPQVTRTALDVGLESVAFSLDGLKETHEYIRRVPGLFEHVLDCMDQCRDQGLTVSAITMINRRVVPELDALHKLLADHGVARWQLQLGTPSGNMSDNPDLVLEPHDLLTLMPKVASLCGKIGKPKIFPGHNLGYFGEPEAALRDRGGAIPFWVGCSAGCSVIGIESNGNIKGCLSLPSSMNGVDEFVEGNIRQTPLAEIWRRKGAFAYNRNFQVRQLNGFCRNCDYAEICRGGCTWAAFSKTGTRYDNVYCYWQQLQLKQQKDAASSEPFSGY
jgi:radical SAM protein with 4Fe4S-binding SPASM domain